MPILIWETLHCSGPNWQRCVESVCIVIVQWFLLNSSLSLYLKMRVHVVLYVVCAFQTQNWSKYPRQTSPYGVTVDWNSTLFGQLKLGPYVSWNGVCWDPSGALGVQPVLWAWCGLYTKGPIFVSLAAQFMAGSLYVHLKYYLW